MRSVALLANLDSGRGAAERVEGMLAEQGATVTAFDVHECEAAAASGAERLVVAGGDGSIGFAAAAASEAGIPIAVVATGTANDFAVQIGLPAALGEACELAVRGEKRRALELAHAGSRPYVNVASLGLSPTAAEHADGLKGRMGALAYPVGALRAGAEAHPVSCIVSSEGTVLHEGKAWQVSIASTGAFGGGSSLEADASDGKLDLVVIEGSGRARLVKHAYGLRVGGVEEQKGVFSRRCSSIDMELDESECLNVDGELIEASELADGGSIHFAVTDDAFELIVG